MIHVGVLKVDFHVPESGSLKEKRMVLRRLKDRIQNNFNVSIAEVDDHDKWQAAALGVATISNDKKHVDSTLSKIKNFFEKERSIVIIDYQTEVM